MPNTFHADPTTGVIVYESTDDLPRTDPFGYRSRVHFYSGWLYPARVVTQSGSLALSAGTAGSVPDQPVNVSHTLFAHGRGAVPLMLEGIWFGIGTAGTDVPMIGSIPVQNQSSFRSRWLTLGADETYVYVHEQHNSNVFGGGALASLTLSWQVHVIDFVTATAGTVLEWTPTRFRAGYFDSEQRYIRQVGSGGYALASGITTNHAMSAPTGAGSERIVWHHAITGSIDVAATATTTGSSVDPGTPTPMVKAVTI